MGQKEKAAIEAETKKLGEIKKKEDAGKVAEQSAQVAQEVSKLDNPSVNIDTPEVKLPAEGKDMTKAQAQSIVNHYANIDVIGLPADLKEARKVLGM